MIDLGFQGDRFFTYVFDCLSLDSILDVLVVLSPLSHTFEFLSHH